MKRITFKQRQQCLLLNQSKRLEGRRNAGAKRRIRFRREAQNKIYGSVRIAAPEVFCLSGEANRQKLLSFIDEIRSVLKSSSVNVFITFSKTKKLLPCGTLYFRANICKLIELYPSRISCNYPIDDVVGQLFQHIGLLARMGLGNKFVITADNVKYWHSVEGTKADATVFEDILHSYEDELNKPMRQGLYESMTEAVTNCVQHAYETLGLDEKNQRWWMFAHKNDNNLTVAIYDLGIGIAASLRIKPEIVERLKKLIWGTKKSDRRLLQLAVGSPKTRTKLPYRGKGLPEMMEFIKNTNYGGLLIHSNHGTYMYAANTGTETVKSYNQPLLGTLVQWTLPLIDETVNE